MAHGRGGVKGVILTDGYGKRKEVKELIAAVCQLSGPGTELHSIAQNAIEAFRALGYADQCRASDALASHSEVMLGLWTAEIRSLLET